MHGSCSHSTQARVDQKRAPGKQTRQTWLEGVKPDTRSQSSPAATPPTQGNKTPCDILSRPITPSHLLCAGACLGLGYSVRKVLRKLVRKQVNLLLFALVLGLGGSVQPIFINLLLAQPSWVKGGETGDWQPATTAAVTAGRAGSLEEVG